VNNQKAVLKIGTDEFFVTGVTTNTNATAAGTTTTPSVTLQPFFSGVVLDVTPQIDDEGQHPAARAPVGEPGVDRQQAVSLGTAGNLNLPLAASATSELDSIVRGKNGQVVAIGGLMRQSSTADRSQSAGRRQRAGAGQPVRRQEARQPEARTGGADQADHRRRLNNWNDDLLDAGRRIEQLDPAAGMPLMYAAHFGLREAPFGITPDTSFFFGSPRSQEA
jgi:MSHA biogenesis protein MshL